MRWWLAALLVAGLVIVPGCGESKLEEMKRRAIRRSSDDEEEEPAEVAVAEAKPAENAKPSEATNPSAADAAASSEEPSANQTAAGSTDNGAATNGKTAPNAEVASATATPSQSNAETSAESTAAASESAASESAAPTLVPNGPTLIVSPDGKHVLFGEPNGAVGVFDVNSASLMRSFHVSSSPVSAIASDMRRQRIAAADLAGDVRLFNTESADGLDAFERARRERDATVAALAGPPSAVHSLAFAFGGERLAAGYGDGSVRVWRADQALPTFGDGHAGRVLAMASAGDGQALLTASDDGTVRLWDMRTKQAVAEFPTQRQSVTSVAISQDVRYLAAGDQSGMLSVWDLQNPKQPRDVTAHDGAVLSLKFDEATNSLLSSGADGRLRRWSLPLEAARSFAATGLVDDLVTLSRDRRFAGLLDQRGRIHVLRLADGQVVKQFNDSPRKPTSLAFTGDTRKTVAGDESGVISVWDSISGEVLQTLPVHSTLVRSVTAHPAQDVFASAGADGTIAVWNLPAEPRTLANWKSSPQVMARSPDDKLLVVGLADGSLHVWDGERNVMAINTPPEQRPVTAASFSDDGRWIVVGYEDGSVRVWEFRTQTLAEAAELKLHGEEVASVSYASSSRRLWTVDIRGNVRTTRWPHQRERLLAQNGKALRTLAASPDGETVVAGGDDASLRVFRLSASGVTQQAVTIPSAARQVALSATAELAAVVDDAGQAYLVRMSDRHVHGPLTIVGSRIRAVSIRPDGKQLSAVGDNGVIQQWSLPLVRSAETATQAGKGSVAALTMVGKMLAVAGNGQRSPDDGKTSGEIRIWNAATTKLTTFRGHESPLRSLIWSDDGRRLLSVGADKTVRVWDSGSGESLAVFNHDGQFSAACFGGDGQTVLTATGNSVREWSVADGAVVRELPEATAAITSLAVSKSGESAAVADASGAVRLISLSDGGITRELKHAAPIQRIAWSSSGNRLLTVDSAGSVRSWQVAGEPVATEFGAFPSAAEGRVTGIAISADASLVAIGASDGSLQVWESDGDLADSFTSDRCLDVAFAGDRIIAVTGSGSLRQFLRSQSTAWPQQHEQASHVAYSSDGTRLLTGGADGTVRVWNATNGSELHRWTLDSATVVALAISPDGRTVSAAGSDRRVRLWDSEQAANTVTYESAADVTGLAFRDADSLLIAAGTAIQRIAVRTGELQDNFANATSIVTGFAATNGTVVAAIDDGSLRMWEASEATTFRPHRAAPRALAVFHDGHRAATQTDDGRIVLLGADGNELDELQAATNTRLDDIAVTNDGSRIAGLESGGRRVFVWETESGRLRNNLTLGIAATHVHFVADAGTLFVQGAGQVQLMDVESGRVASQVKLADPADLAEFSGTGEVLAVGRSGRFYQIGLPVARRWQADPTAVRNLAFVPDKTWLVAIGESTAPAIWNWSDGTKLRELQHADGKLVAIAASHDGKRIVGRDAHRVFVWSSETGKQERSFAAPGPGDRMSLSPNSERLAFLGNDGRPHVWNLADGSEIEIVGDNAALRNANAAWFLDRDVLLVSSQREPAWQVLPLRPGLPVAGQSRGLSATAMADGGSLHVAAASESRVRLSDSTGRPLHDFDLDANAKVTCLTMNPRGERLAVGAAQSSTQPTNPPINQPAEQRVDATNNGLGNRNGNVKGSGKLYAWNIADRRSLQTIDLPTPPRCLAIAADRNLAAVVCDDDQLRLFDLSSGTLLRRITLEMPVDTLAFVDGEKTLALGFRDGRVGWYPVAIDTWIDAHEGAVDSVCFSGDRHLLTAGADGQVLLWDVEKPAAPLRRYLGREAAVVQARISPTSDHVIGVFADEAHAVAVWPLALDQPTADVKPLAMFEHPRDVACAVTSADGKLLITGGADLVRMWEIAGGKELARFQGSDAAIADLQLDSSNNSIVAVAADRSMRMWNLPAVDRATVPDDGEKLAALDSDRKFTVEGLGDSQPEPLRVRPGAAPTRSGRAGSTRPVDARIVSLEERLRSSENEQDRVAARNLLQRARRERQLLDELDAARDNQQQAAIRRRLEALKQSENAEATAFERFADLRSQISTAADETARAALREQLVEEQREHFRTATELAAATNNATAVVYDDGHPHVMATIRTDYRFQQNDRHIHRPVRLLVSQDMSVVIAAQSSVPGSKETELPGFVEAWDVFSGEKLRAWDDVRNSSVAELHFSPDFQSIVTYPNVYHFNLAFGTSEPFATGCRLATYRGEDPTKEGLIAVGTQGPADAEAPVLRFLSGNPLASRPVSFNAYDAKVTSLAFANRRPWIAFAVRERAGHKVLVADANLAVANMINVDAHRHHRPWNIDEPVLGTTSLAFSPDDKYLVTYGIYDDLPDYDKRRMYLATVWQADWEAKKFTKVFESEPKRDPLLLEIGSQAIRFVGDTSFVSFPTSGGFSVVDLENKGEPVMTISLPTVQKGRAETCFSDDGRWLAAGDDTGQITLWNLETGKSRSLTLDGRPAHGGPVVGLAFSATHPATRTIDFLVSAGEENKIKIWSLVERLNPKLYEAPAAPPPRPVSGRVSRTR